MKDDLAGCTISAADFLAALRRYMAERGQAPTSRAGLLANMQRADAVKTPERAATAAGPTHPPGADPQPPQLASKPERAKPAQGELF